jgi:hypothetical protein
MPRIKAWDLPSNVSQNTESKEEEHGMGRFKTKFMFE